MKVEDNMRKVVLAAAEQAHDRHGLEWPVQVQVRTPEGHSMYRVHRNGMVEKLARFGQGTEIGLGLGGLKTEVD